MSVDKEKIDELENEVWEQKLKGVRGQVMALGDTLHQRMDNHEEKNTTEFNHIKEALEDIKETGKETLAQARQTNGRVTIVEAKVERIEEDVEETIPEKINKLEKDTRIVRFMHKYPKVTVILIVVLYLFSIQEIREVVVNTVSNFFSVIGKLV